MVFNESRELKMFQSHGEVEISVVDNIITIACIGCFNAEFVRNYASKIHSVVTSLNDKPFVMIIDNTKFEGCTPEGFEELELINIWLNSTKLKAKAFIIYSEINTQIISARSPSLSLQNIKFFSSSEEAKEWVKKFN